MKPARVLFWDLETTSLKADFGFVLAAGFKFLGEKKVTVLSIGDFHSGNFRAREKALVQKFVDVLSSADISVTHNGQRYDHPWINAKCLEHGIPLPPPIPQVDTLQIARKHLKAVSRKRLDTLSYYLGTSEEKTPVEGKIWVDAAIGDRKALKYIIDHCRADVLVLEEVYLRLRPLLLGHPRVAGWGPCRHCGSERLQRRGQAYSSAKGPQARVQCQDCGGWENRLLKESWGIEDAANFARRKSTPTESHKTRKPRPRGTDGKPKSKNRKGRVKARRAAAGVAARHRRVARRRKSHARQRYARR
ncbi:MAG: ribonuclease H-like domain-containing protein [Patescibacteria group bacterium]|nr:ribonuclease H-like domain-containing protein [Patescibacteria group bacterium]